MILNFSDTSRPGLVKVNLVNGAITVRVHSGNNVVIQGSSVRRTNQTAAEAAGLRRIGSTGNGLVVEEENNVISVASRGMGDSSLDIQVPAKTNLNLKTVNGGEIRVDGVEGEIEVENTNGGVLLNNVSGSVVAHATNGRVTASLREITPNKAMSFTSMNSNVDITLPPATKANLNIRTDNGEAWSDFDVESRPAGEDNRNRGGRPRDRSVVEAINGGGPEFDLRTLNGNIYIRKGK